MIFFQTEQHYQVVILNPQEIEDLKAGKVIVPHTKTVVVAYTPDEKWMKERLLEVFSNKPFTLEPAKFDELLRQAQNRPEVR